MTYSFNNLRNNFSGFSYQYSISDSDISFINKLLIVQYCSGNACPSQIYRFKNSHWRYCACSSNIYLNIKKLCFFFFRRKFISYCPFRYFCSRSHYFPLFKIIDFNYNTVNIKRVIIPAFTDFIYFSNNFFIISAFNITWYNLKPQRFYIVQ